MCDMKNFRRTYSFTDDELDERDWLHMGIGFCIGSMIVGLAWVLIAI